MGTIQTIMNFSIYNLHSALLISDLGIYFSNPRGTYIEQASPGEQEKKTSGKWDLNLQLRISVILCGCFCDAGLSSKYQNVSKHVRNMGYN